MVATGRRKRPSRRSDPGVAPWICGAMALCFWVLPLLLTLMLSLELWSDDFGVGKIICFLLGLGATPLALALGTSAVTIALVRPQKRWMRNAAIVTLSPLGLILMILLSAWVAQGWTAAQVKAELDGIDAAQVTALEFRTWDGSGEAARVTGSEKIEPILKVLQTATVCGGHGCGTRSRLDVVEQSGMRHALGLYPGDEDDDYELSLSGRMLRVDKRSLLAALARAGVGERFAPHDLSYWFSEDRVRAMVEGNR